MSYYHAEDILDRYRVWPVVTSAKGLDPKAEITAWPASGWLPIARWRSAVITSQIIRYVISDGYLKNQSESKLY